MAKATGIVSFLRLMAIRQPESIANPAEPAGARSAK